MTSRGRHGLCASKLLACRTSGGKGKGKPKSALPRGRCGVRHQVQRTPHLEQGPEGVDGLVVDGEGGGDAEGVHAGLHVLDHRLALQGRPGRGVGWGEARGAGPEGGRSEGR